MRKYFRIYLDSFRGLSTPTWVLSAVILINRTGAMVLPFLGIYLKEVLGFSIKEAGFVLSCYGLGSMTGSVVGGKLTDKFGHFKIQVSSLFLSVPFFIILSFLKSLAAISAGIFLLSTIVEIFRPANSVSISFYAKPQNLTRAFSLNRMALNLGFSTGPAIGGLLAAVSYQLLFYGNAFTVLVAGVVLYLYFHKNRGGGHRVYEESSEGPSPWRDRDFMIFNILCVIFNLGFFQLISTMPMYYKDVFSLSNEQIGLLMGFNGLVVFTLEMVTVSFLERKFTISQTIISGILIASSSFVILAYAHSLLMLYIAMFMFSFAEIFTMPFITTVVINRAGKGRRGDYMGANSLSYSTAFILVPLMSTMVAQHFTYRTLWISIFIITGLTAFGFSHIMRKMKSDSAQYENLQNS
ncbi:MAG: MFS transporter [Chitinophagaceae bacterium]|nr:MFS transporter [Chitinophagaceae bacterium]